jgi:hypothetical protein
MTSGALVAASLAALAALGCSSSTVEPGDGTSEPSRDVLALVVGPDARTFVELSKPSALDLAGTGETSIAWDLALQGRDVFTNGGVSGPGNSSAFGPLSAPTFLSDSAPDTPLLLKDRAGGPLLDWYDYAGESHQLYSRYHVYGLRDGERRFKLQLLGYYAEELGAPISAHYSLRYAEVLPDGSNGEIIVLSKIDASAGGSKDNEDEPSACVDLDSQEVSLLRPDDASESDAWHLCFRREAVSVNGGRSGPRGVESVDLQAADSPNETEKEIQARTAASELAVFEAVDFDTLDDDALGWRVDGVATAFADLWLEPGSEPLALSDTVWLVVAADGVTKHLVKLEDLQGDPATEQATLGLRAKRVR